MFISHRQKVLTALTALCVITSGAIYVYILRQQISGAYDIDTTVAKVQAVQADSLVESMGINIHVQTWNPTVMQQDLAAMSDMGMRHFRSDAPQPYDSNGTAWINAIHQFKQIGASTAATFGINLSASDISNYIHAANDSVPNTIDAADTLNEIDFGCNGTFGNIWVQCIPTSRWLDPTNAFMQAMITTLRADPSTQNLAVYSPSINGINFGVDNSILGGGSDTHYFGNLHYYPQHTPWMQDSVLNEMSGAAQLYPNKPLVMTEFGHPDISTDPNQPSDQATQAKILSSIYLENFRDGIARTFVYELDDPGGNWPDERYGISTADGTRKLAYTAIKNLITTFKDPGTPFSPGYLRYELTGSSVNGIATKLFQKRDGTYYLALWKSSTTNSPAPLAGKETTKTVGIKFGTAIDTAGLINPLTGSGTTQTYTSPTSLSNIQLGDGPVIFKILASAEPTPSPDPSPTPTPTPTATPHYSPAPSHSPTALPRHKPTPSAPTPSATTPTEEPTPSPTATPTPSPAQHFTPLPSIDIFSPEDHAALDAVNQSWWEKIKAFLIRSWKRFTSLLQYNSLR